MASTPSGLSTLCPSSLQSGHLTTPSLRLRPWKPLVSPAINLTLSHLSAVYRLLTMTIECHHSPSTRCLPWKLLFIHPEWAQYPFWAKPFVIPAPSIAQPALKWTFKGAPQWSQKCLPIYLRPLSTLVLPESSSQVCVLPGDACLSYNPQGRTYTSPLKVHSQCPAQGLAPGCYPVCVFEWMNSCVFIDHYPCDREAGSRETESKMLEALPKNNNQEQGTSCPALPPHLSPLNYFTVGNGLWFAEAWISIQLCRKAVAVSFWVSLTVIIGGLRV